MSAHEREFDLGLGVLDHQLVDSEGRNCGNVDDLEIAGVSSGEPEVIEILVGGNAWKSRGFFGRIAAALSGDAVHVPWSEVDEVGAVVKLKHTAQELRLGRGDDKAARFVKRLPGA
jgi:sporulation protein YlmC with PRC-barrel domain